MRQELASLKPEAIWKKFDELLNIPRASGHEEQVAAWLAEYAGQRGFGYCQDEAGNVILEVTATQGREQTPLTILQGHMDMVTVKSPESGHDFSRDPIEIKAQDGFISARDTSLGADNGIGICTILALLEDKSLSHGPLRAIFTVEEETTMKGACDLRPQDLDAAYLINLDSEQTDELCVSCAGSCDLELTCRPVWIKPEECQGLTLTLTGLCGGHSGSDINRHIPNAILTLTAVLKGLSENFDFFIVSAKGGTARNAIPSECAFTLAVPKDQYADLIQAVRAEESARRNMLQTSCLKLDFKEATCERALSYAESMELIALIGALPNGVLQMSQIDPLIVETSSNLGLISSDEESFRIILMPRSLLSDGLTEVCDKVSSVLDLTSCWELEVTNAHPCWSPGTGHYLQDQILRHFAAVTGGRNMRVTAMHAGIECAQYAAKNPKLEQISLGPTILNPHSIQERVEIAGVNEIYQTVRRTLSAL